MHTGRPRLLEAEWDDHYHMLENGWRFFLWNLKHHLERHRGIPRRMISQRPTVQGSRDEVWKALFGPDGLAASIGTEGDPFSLALDGLTLEGTTVIHDAPWAFAGRVASVDDGVLHVEMEGTKIGIWLSGYGIDEAEANRLEAALASAIQRIFPQDPE